MRRISSFDSRCIGGISILSRRVVSVLVLLFGSWSEDHGLQSCIDSKRQGRLRGQRSRGQVMRAKKPPVARGLQHETKHHVCKTEGERDCRTEERQYLRLSAQRHRTCVVPSYVPHIRAASKIKKRHHQLISSRSSVGIRQSDGHTAYHMTSFQCKSSATPRYGTVL
jgi:hypothetical protein